MRIKSLWPLLVVSLFMTSVLPPSAARARQRGLNVGQPVPEQQAGVGRYYALVIGNQAYVSLPRLKTAEADARAVDALLREFYGFETKLLLDATRQQIVSTLYSYRQTLGPDANLLIYYAGHGMRDPGEEKAYWLPVDATRDDPSNWIIADEITARIKVIPARHVLVVSDSCYSGTLMRELPMPVTAAALRQQWLEKMLAGRSRTLMASGGDEPVADGGGGNHSVFANALLRGLREMDKEGFTAAELFRYHVEEPVAGRAQQMPEYNVLRSSGHESGDFVFVRAGADAKRAALTRAAPPVAASALESEHWNAIKDGGDPEEYQEYLKKYPDGQFAATARQRATGEREGEDMGGGVAATGTANASASNQTGGGRAPSPGGARQSNRAGRSAAGPRVTNADAGREWQPQAARATEQRSAGGDFGRGRRP